MGMSDLPLPGGDLMTPTRKSAAIVGEAALQRPGLVSQKAASGTYMIVSETGKNKADLIVVPLPKELRTAVITELRVARRQLDKLIAKVEATKAAEETEKSTFTVRVRSLPTTEPTPRTRRLKVKSL
jgi:hypothetical protein